MSSKISTSTIGSSHNRNFLCAAFSVTLLLMMLTPAGFGQGGAATGDLHISVKDPSGNAVTGAAVTVSDVEKGVERAATGDGQGGYSVRQLPPGVYSVAVDAAGFSKAEAKNVSITVGGLVELPVGLVVASGKEVIEVTFAGGPD